MSEKLHVLHHLLHHNHQAGGGKISFSKCVINWNAKLLVHLPKQATQIAK